jgi:hypothetical protein
MSVKKNAPIRLTVPSGTWTGVVRRVGGRLDLLVETSGSLRIGDVGSFELEVPGHSVEGKMRVRNGGERSGPYARYILQVTEIGGRNRQLLLAWSRGELRQRATVTSPGGPRLEAADPPEQDRRTGRQLPKVTVEVDEPVALRTSRGAVEGTLVRFHGNEFLVELASPLELDSQAFFQFEVPGFGIDVFGTAQVDQEAWRDHDSCGYVLSMHLMRRADRDLLREWLEDQAGEVLDRLEYSSGFSEAPTDVPSDLPPDDMRALASSNASGRGAPRPGAVKHHSGRDTIREILIRRFFKKDGG